MIQVFFRSPKGRTACAQLLDGFTLDDFIETAGDVLGFRSRDETLSWRYTVGSKPLDVNHVEEFDRQKQSIIKDCNIFVLGRLLGGQRFPETLQAIVESELEVELAKVITQSTDCFICLDSETDCVKVCCTSMCRPDLRDWLRGKNFEVSCMVCSKAIALKEIFKSPEYVATLNALREETQLLRNMDCQRCLNCDTLMHNETMYTRQTCVSCSRVFCFFCNRRWAAGTMHDRRYTCGKECVYETMISFELIAFHYNANIKIPSQRTCPRCFNFGSYDRKCKYHTCEECKLTFCFLCLEEEDECKQKHKSDYNHACVQTPVPQTYSMFPRLISE
ncbi:hypothetical protein BGX28_005203 [Mortierella sp. GBA30]|nr:hypothetical protein BGX28_005203 [Mortierella sp. GBA30]